MKDHPARTNGRMRRQPELFLKPVARINFIRRGMIKTNNKGLTTLEESA
jgi:hypothetical protein